MEQKKGGERVTEVISFHHGGIFWKAKVVDFIWVFCFVRVIELWGELLCTPTLMHSKQREMNYLIYCLWDGEEGWRLEETWWNLINALITFVSPAVLGWDVKLPPVNQRDCWGKTSAHVSDCHLGDLKSPSITVIQSDVAAVAGNTRVLWLCVCLIKVNINGKRKNSLSTPCQ